MAEHIDTALGRFTSQSARFARHTATSEPLQLRLMRRAFELLDGVDALYDVGANLGVYSVFLGVSGACRQSVAFEPDPRTFWELSANLALNFGDGGQARALNIAASDAEGEARFDERTGLGPGNRILARPQAQAKGRETVVRTARLDDALTPEGPRDAILKMDVEGHEITALAGADRLVANRVAYAQIECWKGRERQRAELKAFMAERGFRLLCRVKGDHIFLHQDFEDAGPALMEAYFDHADEANTLLERIAIFGVKSEISREVSDRAVDFFNGFDRINLAKTRRRLDRLTGRKGSADD